MKKHQLAAMVLSALSAGVLISCSKPADEAQNSTSDQEAESLDSHQTDNNSANNKASQEVKSDAAKDNTSIEPIEISEKSAHSYMTQVADSQILPAYRDVTDQSRALYELANEYCQGNVAVEGDKLVELRKQWLNLAKAWAYAEIINYGPAMDSMSNLYINYYPDERGLVHQGVIDVIDANPNLTPENLASESAIVQGIPGLEEVLFANDPLTPAQCNYVVSASSALTHRLEDIENAWMSTTEDLLGISDGDSKTGINRWINSILSLIETTKSRSLDQPLGLTGNKKGHLPADAANQSREIITAKVAALNKALTDPMLIAILAEGGQDTLADELSTKLSEISSLLAELPEDIAEANTENQRSLYDKLTELTQIIKHKLMPTLGVQVGFNSTDGD